jgi:Ca-activated chloride channel family protein
LSKRRRLIVYTIVIAVIAICLSALVWGKTWRTARANRLLLTGELDKAVTLYQKLLTGTPDSPVVLNNLGLCLYRQGKYEAAAGYFRKALKAVSGKSHQAGQSQLLNNIHYHLGNSLFKLAAKGQPDQAYNLFNEALSNYRQAIEAGRSDQDAKYNYELTRLRVDQAQQQQEQQNQQDRKDQQNRENQQGKEGSQGKPDNQGKQQEQSKQEQQQNQAKSQNNQSKQPQEQTKQSGRSGQNQSAQGTMSKAEAEALLKAAENGDQYQGRVMVDDQPAGSKDW